MPRFGFPMATSEQKVRKKIKSKFNTKAKSKTDPEAKEQNNSNSEKEKKPNSGGKKLKKKLKIKSKPEEPIEPKLKPSSNKESEKKVDERIFDAQFEPEIKAPDSTKPEQKPGQDERIYYLTGKGKPHPVHELSQDLRKILLNSGFNELENHYFVPEKDIYEQYEDKSGLVFDKTYYLAENQKPQLELGKDQVQQLKNTVHISDLDTEKLFKLIADLNENKVELSQFFNKLKEDLDLSDNDIFKLLEFLPQLRNPNPKLMHFTLRSAMDQPWLPTLTAIMDKENLPVKVFSMGVWFKRKSKLNDMHLRSHYGASCIIMDKNISINNGKAIAEAILDQLGFEDLEVISYNKSQYFSVNFKEFEIYCKGIKIATCGRFSIKKLKKFGIDIPVLYINLGLEHMSMVQKGFEDIRELMYPQFYQAWKLNDHEIALAIQFIQKPKTELGNEIAANLYKTCKINYNTPSPCEFTIWEGLVQSGVSVDEESNNDMKTATIEESAQGPAAKSDITNELGTKIEVAKKRLIVKVVKKDENSKLCGPAFLNEIVVKNGDIYGIQNPDQNQEYSGGVKTEISYLDAFTKSVGSQIETQITKGELNETSVIQAGIIKDMEDINLQLDSRAVRFILTNNKKVDVRGPMFVNVEYKLEDLVDEDVDADKIKVEPKKPMERSEKNGKERVNKVKQKEPKELKQKKEKKQKEKKKQVKPKNEISKKRIEKEKEKGAETEENTQNTSEPNQTEIDT
jgi:O-phosphoseryl-tRNA synthetase